MAAQTKRKPRQFSDAYYILFIQCLMSLPVLKCVNSTNVCISHTLVKISHMEDYLLVKYLINWQSYNFKMSYPCCLVLIL